MTQTSLSPTLIHLIAHPPAMIAHLSSAYSTPPPPAGPAEKFWSVFIPFSERTHESDRLVYGPEGNGTSAGSWRGEDTREFVVEVLVRGGSRRGVERTIEGWVGDAPCDLYTLESLKSIWHKKKTEEVSRNGALTGYILPNQPIGSTGSDAECIIQSEPHAVAREIASPSAVTIYTRR
jgi:elongator complex protein 5